MDGSSPAGCVLLACVWRLLAPLQVPPPARPQASPHVAATSIHTLWRPAVRWSASSVIRGRPRRRELEEEELGRWTHQDTGAGEPREEKGVFLEGPADRPHAPSAPPPPRCSPGRAPRINANPRTHLAARFDIFTSQKAAPASPLMTIGRTALLSAAFGFSVQPTDALQVGARCAAPRMDIASGTVNVGVIGGEK
jgi:hypothetical protein